jgi:hypothetical protein
MAHRRRLCFHAAMRLASTAHLVTAAMVSTVAFGATLARAQQNQLKAKLDGMKKVLAFCAAKTDCKERAECMLPFIEPGAGRKPK